MTQTQSVIQFASVSDISVVSELKQQFSAALADQHPITIEAGDVERIDATCLQLLVAFFSEISNLNISCTWGATSAAVRDAACLCGVDQLIGLVEDA